MNRIAHRGSSKSSASYAPVVGESFRYLLLGGTRVGQPALLRFYVLHVALLPALAGLLLAVHLYRVRKDGGLARPDEPELSVTEGSELPAAKSYGLMALTRATGPAVGQEPADEVLSWPHLLFREMLLFLGTCAVVLLLSILFDAPLEEVADPIRPPNPAKAPWYFLGLQELVSYSAFVGGVLVPAVLVGALLLLPFLDRKRVGVGRWFAPQRRTANVAFATVLLVLLVLIVVGHSFRGPNWQWQWPWAAQAAGEH